MRSRRRRAGAAGAGATMPLWIRVVYHRGSRLVDVSGYARPGTVVRAGHDEVAAGAQGAFALTTAPGAGRLLALLARRGSRQRRLQAVFPHEAMEKWLPWIAVEADLTRMRAHLSGTALLRNGEASTLVVRHWPPAVFYRTPVENDLFRVESALMPRTNTFEWAVRAGSLTLLGPDVTLVVD